MTIRERLEQNEKDFLSQYACLSTQSRGRDFNLEQCNIRTDFQRDRDRIIHCNSFRRLKHKTQVFLAPQSDHYRARLTHTLEVSQIARTISRALALNEDLTEAIALGHDLGHTPFGHTGEKVLNEILSNGFKHNVQSVRTVEKLENKGKGLNLTVEVRDGILKHSDSCESPITLEGKVVRLADKIAYINHDIEDAIRAKVLTEEELPIECTQILGDNKSKRISTIINSVVTNSVDDIIMQQDVHNAHYQLKRFMYKNVYANPLAKSQDKKSEDIIKFLYEYFTENYDELPSLYHQIAELDSKEQAVADYIAGMTDTYAIEKFKDIFIPKCFSIKGDN